jgi:hypothetical protein
MSSLSEPKTIPACTTTINDLERYTDISCYPMDPSHGPSAAVSLQELSKVPCSYIKADNSIRMGWRDPVIAWTRKTPFGEPGKPGETVRGSWNIQFVNAEGDKTSCISLVEVEDKMVEYGGSLAELQKDRDGSLMYIWNPDDKHPRAEPFRVTVRPAGGIREKAEEDEQSPWVILSLRDGTLKGGPEEGSVIPEGMSVNRLSVSRYPQTVRDMTCIKLPI